MLLWRKYILSRLITVVAAVLLPMVCGSPSFAVPAAPEKIEAFQPDGTKFKARLRGDERRHWHETDEGYSVMRDRASGWWHYAEPDEIEGIKPGAARVGKSLPGPHVQKGLKPSKKLLRKLPRKARGFDAGVVSGAGLIRKAPGVSHTQPLLVIPIEFDDVKHTYNTSSFQSLFFEETKSVADYYGEVSYGTFTIVPATESSGLNDGVIDWVAYGLPHPDCVGRSYPYELQCDHDLAYNAINAADQYVNFASFDADGNKEITPDELAVIIVVAGYEGAYGNNSPSVWAHQDELSNPLTLDGKKIRYYAMFGEKQGSHQATIGVMVHELGHLMLDLPDLYDTDSNSSSQGAGPFDVMAGGSWCKSSPDESSGATPVHPSAWTKAYAGFITPEEATNQAGVSLPSVSGMTTNIVKVPTQNPDEFFLLENRYFTGYDAGLKGCLEKVTGEKPGGIALWHIDESLLDHPSCIDSNDCNNNPSRKLVDLEEAHKGGQDLDSSGGDGTLADLFCKGRSITFNQLTAPDSKLYDGIPSGISVTNISYSGETMTADIFTGNPRFAVTVAKSEWAGAVISLDGGIDCGDDCSGSYEDGAEITLTAVAGAGSTFAGWSGGACSGTSPTCTFAISSSDAVVGAAFITSADLTVTKSGSGTGLVKSGDGSVNCGPVCAATYPAGEKLTLTARPDVNSVFAGWSGAESCSTGKRCRLAMTESFNVSALFERKYYTITSRKTGAGGRITPSGVIKVKPGLDRPITIKPNKGFKVSDVLVDGNSVGAVTEYPFEAVAADHTIEVTFSKQ